MPAADYRILTDATGQRIAAALEGVEGNMTDKLPEDFSTLSALPADPATGDLLPIASGGTTYKIDYNALAAAILDRLGAGSDGIVDITHGGTSATTAAGALESLGAAADSAAMQYRGWYPNGQSMLSLTPGYYKTSPRSMPSETFPSNINEYGMLCVDTAEYTHITYTSLLGDFMFWKANSPAAWYVVQVQGSAPVSSGGTGATNPSGARANLEVKKIIYQDLTTTQSYNFITGVTRGWISLQTPSGYQPLCARCTSATDSNYGDVTSYIIPFVSDVLNFVSSDSRTLNVTAGMTFRVFYIEN